MPAEIARERGRLAEHAAQARADILAVEQTARILLHQLADGEERAVHHHRGLTVLRRAIAFLFVHWRRREVVRGEVGGRRVIGSARAIEVGLHAGDGLLLDLLQAFELQAAIEALLEEAREGIALAVLGEVLLAAVELHAHPAGVVVEQRHLGMHEERSTLLAHQAHDLIQRGVARDEVGAIHLAHLEAGEALRVFARIGYADLVGAGADVPFIVLHQVDDGQLFKHGHLESLCHFALGDGRIADGAHHDGRLLIRAAVEVVRDACLLLVPHPHGDARGGDGLHARCAALVRDARHACAPKARMAVIGAPSAEGVIPLAQQLQHQLVRLHADAEQDTVVAVVGRHEILRLQLQTERELDGLVPAAGGMHVLARELEVLLVQFGHGLGRAHQLPSAQERVLIRSAGLLREFLGGGESHAMR